MDELRLILLLIGAGVILAVYLWTRLQTKPRKAAASPAPAVKRQQADDPGDADIDRELQRMEQLLRDRETAPRKEDSQRLIVVSVVAAEGQSFSGKALLKAFENNGLLFGEHDIYHRMTDSSDGEQPVFSVANMVKPGTLIPAKMGSFATPGLTLFLQLTAPLDAVQAFDDFVHTAERLAVELGGVLRDEQHNVLRHQTLMQLRESIVEEQMLRRAAS